MYLKMDCSPISKKNEMKRNEEFYLRKENEDTLVRQKEAKCDLFARKKLYDDIQKKLN